MKLLELEHKLLRALPADAYELRDAVTKLFERITVQHISSWIGEPMFETSTTGQRYLIDRAERLHCEGLVGSIKPFVTHEWANNYEPGRVAYRTLRSSIVFIKPLGDPIAGADDARRTK